jgi:AcrR family transcriptional regulator
MTQRTTQDAPLPPAGEDQSTRQRLLEIAGRVFADKGFDRATGKEICEQAGANTAAVNYYFGGMAGLYAAVLQEAFSRLVTAKALSAAVADQTDARSRLEAILTLCVRTLTGLTSASWVLRVVAREIVAPSPALTILRETEMVAKTRILRAVVGELMGLPPEHPAVARGCVSVLAPCVLLLLHDRGTFHRAFPDFGMTAADAPVLVRHLMSFALAGLAAVAAEARQQRGEGGIQSIER